MTDKEIIKAFKRCIEKDCQNCPDSFHGFVLANCEYKLMTQVLDLINRQIDIIDLALHKPNAETEFANYERSDNNG